jgi:hypothetical protein
MMNYDDGSRTRPGHLHEPELVIQSQRRGAQRHLLCSFHPDALAPRRRVHACPVDLGSQSPRRVVKECV